MQYHGVYFKLYYAAELSSEDSLASSLPETKDTGQICIPQWVHTVISLFQNSRWVSHMATDKLF